MSDGDEIWYVSPKHHVGEVYQVSPLSDPTHMRGVFLCTTSRNYCPEKKCISIEPAHIFSVRWGWNLVHLSNTSFWRGITSFTSIRHRTCVRARPKCAFCHAHAGIAKRKTTFRSSPCTCLVSDRNETWYISPAHYVGEAYQVSPPSNTEHVRGRVLNVFFFYAHEGIA